MNNEDGFPKLSSAQRTGSAGVTIVTKLVEDELNWRFRRNHQEDDFGIDGYVDIVGVNGSVLGRSFAVQIKTGQSHVAKTTEQGFLLYGERKHLNYFLNSSVPIILIWVDDSSSRAWWVHIKPYAVRLTKTGWSILIPKANLLDTSCKAALSAIAGPTSNYLPLLEQVSMMRNTARQMHLLLFHVAKMEVETGDISRLKEFFDMFEAAPDVLSDIRNKLVLGVQGYDDDSREVYEIPEVRNWFSKAEKMLLGWAYYLLLDSEFSTFHVFFFCTCKFEVKGVSNDGAHKILNISHSEGAAFLKRHFEWLNEFTEKHQIPLSVNKEISLAMGQAARKWFSR